MYSKECEGCAEILQEPTKKDGKGEVGKGKQPTTKRTQGYLCVCVSADLRESGSVEGGENFIITVKELRLSLQGYHYKLNVQWKTRQSG